MKKPKLTKIQRERQRLRTAKVREFCDRHCIEHDPVILPMDFLLDILNDCATDHAGNPVEVSRDERVMAAKELLPYFYSKNPQAVNLDTPQGVTGIVIRFEG